jgi:hypothetical protein
VHPGDKVRIIGVPPDLPEDERLQSRALFERCIGEIFPIVDIAHLEGPPYKLLQLDVGNVVGKPACMETIWTELQYVEPAPEE